MIDILDDLLGSTQGTEGRDAQGAGPRDQGPDTCLFCSAPSMATCSACGRAVCREHSWTMLGLCTHCAREDRIDYFQRAPDPEKQNWLEGP